MWRRAEAWIHKNEWLLLVLIGFLLIRLPSLFEPYWYGDEGIYLSIGQSLNKGVSLYSGIHDNKPPFLYLVAALSGGNIFWFRLISLAWGGMTVLVGYSMFKSFFHAKLWQTVVSAWVLVLVLGLPFWEGNVANAELYFILPNILAFGLLMHSKSSRQIFWAGMLFGVAGLFKVPAMIDMLIWPFVWMIYERRQTLARTFFLVCGAFLPIGLSCLYFLFFGNILDYINAAWLSNFPYLTSWGSAGSSGKGMLLRISVFLSLFVVAVLGRKFIKREVVVVGLWLAASGFASYLSGRPYPHYLLQTAAPLSLAVGILVGPKIGGKLFLASVGLVIGFFYATLGFKSYPVVGYYKNFSGWLMGQKTIFEYFQGFDSQTNNNYEIASTVASGSSPSDELFVWGDQPVIYALAKRNPATKFIVKYHILDYKAESATLAQLEEHPPRYIVSFGEESRLPGFANFLSTRYALEKNVGSAQIFRLSRLAMWLR